MNKNLLQALKKNGFEMRIVTLTDGKQGIMIDTNYNGPYPTRQTLQQHRILDKIVKRYDNFITEPRGYYTAYLIKEK